MRLKKQKKLCKKAPNVHQVKHGNVFFCRDSKHPRPPPGTKWKEVRHDNKVTWLASWTENIQGSIKYIMLNPSSRIKVSVRAHPLSPGSPFLTSFHLDGTCMCVCLFRVRRTGRNMKLPGV